MNGAGTQDGGRRAKEMASGPWPVIGEKQIPKSTPLPPSSFFVPDSTPSRFFFPLISDPAERPPTDAAPSIVWPDHRDTKTASACAVMADGIVRQLSGNEITSTLTWKRHQVVAWTSPGEGDGKTDLLLALAPSLAERITGGILVVDANPYKPSLTKRLNVPKGNNLQQKPLIYPTNRNRLNVMPISPSIRSHGFDDCWMEKLREGWPLTVLDMASLADPRAVSLACRCDGVYLTVRLGYTSRRAITEATRLIHHAGGRLLGCLAIA
jgi:Mrp family chromosome partitioning ATPase